ncbi:polar amino acid ABC transporter permease [Loigolactobacillus backii]|uniref:amino acid ABC transporter permease n=1 Tax=Loigolactobacillus backii TaxID=375175 RepID=UPI0007F091D7|nr:amino acid ABC transporter permease [Loigolactobacillus backii]ANK67791.1 polar amino acid ABC transporter permease [Loigolactobacillus backii]
MSWTVIQQSLPIFEKAFWLTLKLSCYGIIGASLLGLFASFIRYFQIPVAKQLVNIYIELSRNTPLLIQLFFIYYAFPEIGLKIPAQTSGIIGLVFLGGSYMAEAFSGGLDGVPKVQIESGKAIGLSNLQLARYVIFPQGLALSVPAIAANVIFLIKETSIFTVIAIPGLTNTALDQIGMYYHTDESLFVLVIGYAIILIPLSVILTWLERRARYGTFGH